MASVNSSPSKLKTYIPFLPNVKFPVYKFKVDIGEWPVRNAGFHFRELDSIEPPESDSNDIFVEEFLFRGFKDENNQRFLFLLNPKNICLQLKVIINFSRISNLLLVLKIIQP